MGDTRQAETFLNRNFEILQSGTGTIGALTAGGVVSSTVTHNLGIVPIPLVYIQANTTDFYALPAFLTIDISTGSFIRPDLYYFCAAGSTTLTINGNSAAATNASMNYRYYLLREKSK